MQGSFSWVARFATRRNYKREIHLFHDFPPIISAHCPLYSIRRVQTLKIKIVSLLSLVVFVLITFELSLHSWVSVSNILVSHTLLIRKENQDGSPIYFQGHSPNPHKIFEAGNQRGGQIFLLLGAIVWPQSLLCPGTAWCYFCHRVFLRCHALSLPSTFVQVDTLQTIFNLKNKFFSLGHHLEKT